MHHAWGTAGIHALPKRLPQRQVGELPVEDIHFLPIVMTRWTIRGRVHASVIAGQAGIGSSGWIVGERLFPDACHCPRSWCPVRCWLMKFILRLCHAETLSPRGLS